MNWNNMQWWWVSTQSYETFDYTKCTHLFEFKEETEMYEKYKCTICWKEKLFNK